MKEPIRRGAYENWKNGKRRMLARDGTPLEFALKVSDPCWRVEHEACSSETCQCWCHE